MRDSILNKVPMDWDITTSASPMEVKNLFGRTIDTGIQHGTVTVMMGKEAYEVTTYRVDGERVFIITEWDRSATTILFADEY